MMDGSAFRGLEKAFYVGLAMFFVAGMIGGVLLFELVRHLHFAVNWR